MSKNVTVRNNMFLLQVKVTSMNPNRIFPTSMNFLLINPDKYELEDLNEGLFDNSVVFNPDEIRSFIYIFRPKNGEQINKFTSEKLGMLEIKWCNYLGDPGELKVGPFKHSFDNQQGNNFELDIEQCRDQDMELKLEEPQDMRFKIQNLSERPMDLVVHLIDRFDNSKDQICVII